MSPNDTQLSTPRLLLAVVLALMVTGTACGSDQPEADAGDTTSTTPPTEADEVAQPDEDEDEDEDSTSAETSDGEADGQMLASAVAAAEALIDTLPADQVDSLLLDYGDSAIVSEWSNLPACDSNGRPGIRHGDLDATQVDAVLTVVDSVLSDAGALEYTQIIAADEELGGGDGEVWDADCYYLAFFGTPSVSEPWAIQFGGHHYARTIDFSDGQVAVTPAFTGVEPRSFTLDGETIMPLADESDAIFGALAALDEAQLSAAELDGRYDSIVMGPGTDSFPETEGLMLSETSDEVHTLVLRAIETWVADFDSEVGAELLAEIEAGLDQTYLGWSTSIDVDTEGGYARIDGPTVWIEFSNEGGVGGSEIHQHSVYRHKELDYGNAG